MFKKVLLPVAGSAINKKTWDYAKHLIEKEGSHIEILYVNEDIWLDSEKTECKDGICKAVNLFDLCDSHIVDINDPHKKKKEDVICEIKTQVQEFFGDYNKNISMKIVSGKPAHQIMAVSKNQGFNLIIMSAHTVSAFKKFALGSVTNKVVNHSEVPVLIVR